MSQNNNWKSISVRSLDGKADGRNICMQAMASEQVLPGEINIEQYNESDYADDGYADSGDNDDGDFSDFWSRRGHFIVIHYTVANRTVVL